MDWDTTAQPEQWSSLQKLTSSLHPGAIYLLHAVSKTNSQILGSFLDNAKDKGYKVGDYKKRMVELLY